MKKESFHNFHRPVLLKEAIGFLNVFPGGMYVDATVGGGGHAEEILKRKGKLIGIDCDPEAIKAARQRLVFACPPDDPLSWRLAQGNFRDIKKIVEGFGHREVNGILFDLGLSSHQLESEGRGFSFRSHSLLDMRMDPSLGVTAADLVNALGQRELSKLFFEYGDEKLGGLFARVIVETRRKGKIETCNQLAEIIEKAASFRNSKIHPATRIFQALRIAVNDELGNLRTGLSEALDLLVAGGRLVIISFHSGEDRIVKNFFKLMEERGRLRVLTKKPMRPPTTEVEDNQKARSARLRVGEKL